jgi:hypothetical protein
LIINKIRHLLMWPAGEFVFVDFFEVAAFIDGIAGVGGVPVIFWYPDVAGFSFFGQAYRNNKQSRYRAEV